MSAEIQLFMKLCPSITGYKMEVDFSKHFSLANNPQIHALWHSRLVYNPLQKYLAST